MKKYLILILFFVLISSCQDEENILTVSDNQIQAQLDKKLQKVVVCHKTGNGSYIPLEISINALPAHLAHGDFVADADKDGYTAVGACTGNANDCNDNDPAINPGAVEVCDGIDNNCNGQVDEGFDVDGDGYTTCEGDCDDNDPNIYPGAEEVCGDNKDNNCDGAVDEGCIQPCGTLTVDYGGKIYHTIQIGTQCWLKENLDVGTRIDGSQNQNNDGVIQKYCYNNDQNNCTIYGGLYLWNETMQYDTTQGAQGICPNGWHIPTLAEFQTLVSVVVSDGKALKAVGQGSGMGAGTNTSGFSALLAGERYKNGYFAWLNFYSQFWSSTAYDAVYANSIGLTSYDGDIHLNYYRNKEDAGFSVRCLKD
jgi:uncharacterized protein (TIGR02145 family)